MIREGVIKGISRWFHRFRHCQGWWAGLIQTIKVSFNSFTTSAHFSSSIFKWFWQASVCQQQPIQLVFMKDVTRFGLQYFNTGRSSVLSFIIIMSTIYVHGRIEHFWAVSRYFNTGWFPVIRFITMCNIWPLIVIQFSFQTKKLILGFKWQFLSS